MTQHWDAWDIGGIAVCLVFISIYVLHLVSKAVCERHWRRMTTHWTLEKQMRLGRPQADDRRWLDEFRRSLKR